MFSSSSNKYIFEQVDGKPSFYNIHMKLRIFNLTKEDFGGYRCLAKNSQGKSDGHIELIGKNFEKCAHIFAEIV